MSTSKQVGCWIAVSVHDAVQMHLEHLGSNTIPPQLLSSEDHRHISLLLVLLTVLWTFPHIRDPDSVPLA